MLEILILENKEHNVFFYLLEHSLDKTVTKSESSSSKRVQNAGVDVGVVLVVVTIADREDVQLSHVVGPKNNGEPLIVGHMLKVCIFKTDISKDVQVM